jgi:hypothetical protein
MNKRILFAVILGVLLVSSLSFSQETASEQSQAKKQPTDPNSAEDVMVTEIVRTKYFPTDELANLIMNIFRIRNIYSDQRSNRLVIQATKGQINDVLALLAKLDVPDSGLPTTKEALSVISRIYMFELPSKDRDMKPFSMILQTSRQFSSTELLNLAKDKNLQISKFQINDDRRGEQQKDILIQGKAASNESIRQMVDNIPMSQINELIWDDETFTNNIEAAKYTQLPEQLIKHIHMFLGDNIQTVGYWFGSSSIPGRIEAPIGPWKLDLTLDKKNSTFDLSINVAESGGMSNFYGRFRHDRDVEILSNTMPTADITKPIIIGYNRKSYGTRKMGAMVILFETDTTQLSVPVKNPR